MNYLCTMLSLLDIKMRNKVIYCSWHNPKKPKDNGVTSSVLNKSEQSTQKSLPGKIILKKKRIQKLLRRKVRERERVHFQNLRNKRFFKVVVKIKV